MSYTNMVAEEIRRYPELKIIDAQQVYKEKYSNVPEQAFYKTMSRMAHNGDITRLTKGIYCIPKQGRFGLRAANQENILDYYLGATNKSGVVIGYRMYNRYALTTQVSKVVELYSNLVANEHKQILNVFLYRADLEFDKNTSKIVELLEVLQNYRNIENLNINNMKKLIEIAVKYYNEDILHNIVKAIKYKKATLASLKNVLDYYDIPNEVNSYLNGTSKYQALKLEDLNDLT